MKISGNNQRIDIYFPDKEKQNRRKGMFATRREDEIFGRKKSDPQIIFFDLAERNEGSVESPQWRDFPILKSPAYTTTEVTGGALVFDGVEYIVETFNSSDYAAYTQQFFDFAEVQDWHTAYRQIDGMKWYDEAGANPPYFDWRVSLQAAEDELYLLYLSYESTDPSRLEEMANEHWIWEWDKKRVKYKGLTELTGNINPVVPFPIVYPGYFGYSTTRKERFKVTAVNDPEAADVGILVPSGRVEVYMMPQIALFAYVGYSADRETQEAMFAYQIQPRYKYPRYVDFSTYNSGGVAAAALYNDFISYQAGRAGMKLSRWNYTGSLSYTESPILSLTGYSSSVFLTLGDRQNETWFTSAAQGAEDDDGSDRFQTFFYPPGGGVSGTEFFINDSPLLTAVVKLRGQFYYIWNIDNFHLTQTSDQHDRFRLSQNISWSPFHITNTQPKDGIGQFFDL